VVVHSFRRESRRRRSAANRAWINASEWQLDIRVQTPGLTLRKSTEQAVIETKFVIA
jgi:hypothetical protein